VVDASEFHRWRDEATDALKQAELSAGADLHNWACFSAEQAAQLAVKGLLHALGKAPWGHDLEALLTALADAGLAVPEEVEHAGKRLSRHYMAARYPDTQPGGRPGTKYLAEDARRALADARLVLALVDEGFRDLAA